MAVKARGEITLSSIVDIASICRYYKLQSSTLAKPAKPTVKPPQNWSTTEPSYTNGSTNSLYTVDLTLYSDNTFSYSEVSLSSSYEAAKAAYNKAVSALDLAEEQTETISSHEARIQANETSIGLRVLNSVYSAYKTSVDGQLSSYGSRLSDAELNISAAMGQIALKVERTDIEEAVAVVDGKFASYSTTSQMTAAITAAKDSIVSGVADTYATHSEVETVSGKVTSLEVWKTSAEQKITKDGIIATVGDYYAYKTDLSEAETRLTSAESTITQHAADIELRVVKNGVISAINQSAEDIAIAANRVNLSGYVTMSNLATAGETTIDGANIKTGKIAADRIDVTDLFSRDITATGTISGATIYGATFINGSKDQDRDYDYFEIKNNIINVQSFVTHLEHSFDGPLVERGTSLNETIISGVSITVKSVYTDNTNPENNKITHTWITPGQVFATDKISTYGDISASGRILATSMTASYIGVGYWPRESESIGCSNWFRSSGMTGWCNDTYGGGWYMSDSTRIRAYANKNVYTAGTVECGSIHCSGWYNDTYGGGWYMSDATWIRAYGDKNVHTAGTVECGSITFYGGTMRGNINTNGGAIFATDGNVYLNSNGYVDWLTNILNSKVSNNGEAGTIYCSNWFRSRGASGWYSEDYGGGWYMVDATYLRAYGNKYIYTAGWIIGDSGIESHGLFRLYNGEFQQFYASNTQFWAFGAAAGTGNQDYFGLFNTQTGLVAHAIASNGSMIIKSLYFGAGLRPTADNAIFLGTTNFRFTRLYAVNSSISTSDANEKTNVIDIDSRYERLFMKFRPVNYKWKNFVDSDAHDRVHGGLIAQEVEQACQECGLDSTSFAALCKDELDEPTVDGRVIRYGLAYGELHGLEIHMIQKNVRHIDSLEQKVLQFKSSTEGELQKAGVKIENLENQLSQAYDKIASLEKSLQSLQASA